ncbi:MAG: family 10 glycosylhydrolase, partial [Planctomycetales bacterium]|nr:family 10 glycosylhydrolase [Planctomycetales bacterium]
MHPNAASSPALTLIVDGMRHAALTLAVVAFCLTTRLLNSACGAAPAFETRAIWIDPASFATQEAADRTLARCVRAGFNVLLPNVMINQTTAFHSKYFRGEVLANDHFDPLAYFCTQAHARQMKVEAWCCVYYEGSVAAAPHTLYPQWLVQSMNHRPFSQHFLSPSLPDVNAYLLSVLKETLEYDVDGIHLDYIRYPGTTFDYSPAARAQFAAEEGFDPQDFLDHAERIVPADAEGYPVRVLNPQSHADKPWETTGIERTLDQARVGFAFVSETPEALSKLRVPGLLVASSYYAPPPETVEALQGYVRRGGDLFWTDAPAAGLAASEDLRRLLGVAKAV